MVDFVAWLPPWVSAMWPISYWSLGLRPWPWAGPGMRQVLGDWGLTRKQQQFLETGAKGVVLTALEGASSGRWTPAHTLLDT